MKRCRERIISLVLAAALLVGNLSVPVNAAVKAEQVATTKLVCDYHSVELDSPMREVEYCDIHTEGMNLTVSGKCSRSYKQYRVAVRSTSNSLFMFYPESLGEQDEQNRFSKTLDFSDVTNGDYLVCVRFNDNGQNQFSNEPQMKYVPIEKNSQGVFVKEYSAIIEENQKIRSANKTKPSYYLDKTMSDMAHELRNGREWSKTDKSKLTSSEVKTIQAFSDKITAGATGDYEKLLAIHDYLAEQLYYDQPYNDATTSEKRQMAKNGQVTLNPYDLVKQLNSGKDAKTVCNGFSALFAALVRCQGIPCRTVGGRSITNVYTSWEKLSTTALSTSTHIWNEAYVNGHWIVVDVTRDCSNDYDGNSYIKPSPIIYRNSGFDMSEESVAVALLYLNYRETPVFQANPPVINTIKSGVVPIKITYSKVSGAAKYSIYRSTSPSGTYKKIGTSKTTTFKDKTAKAGKTYYYKVAAVDKNGVETKLSQWKHIKAKKK